MEKITLPEGWHEVPVGMFQELSLMEDNASFALNCLSVLSDKDPEDLRKIDPVDFQKIIEKTQWCNVLPVQDYKTDISINGIDYYLVKLKSLSIGEWIDLDSWFEKSTENMHKIFALLYRPKDEVYSISKMNERAELFSEKLMISDSYGTLLFFLIIGERYLKFIKDYMPEDQTTS